MVPGILLWLCQGGSIFIENADQCTVFWARKRRHSCHVRCNSSKIGSTKEIEYLFVMCHLNKQITKEKKWHSKWYLVIKIPWGSSQTVLLSVLYNHPFLKQCKEEQYKNAVKLLGVFTVQG